MTTAFAVLFWGTMVLYALVVAAQIYAQTFQREKLARLTPYGVLVGLGAHTVLVAWRWVETGHVPTIGNFENALVGAWFIALMTAWAGWRNKYPLITAASLPFALIILAMGALSDTSPGPMVAALDSFWLYIHIFFAWLAYGAYTISCGAGIAYLVKSRESHPNPDPGGLQRLDELMFRSVVFGFSTDAIMIAAGALWANNLWGAYWSWDPVETWSLLSWLIYGVSLHLRITLGWRDRRMAWVLIVAILGVLISFWGVDFIVGGSAHTFNVD